MLTKNIETRIMSIQSDGQKLAVAGLLYNEHNYRATFKSIHDGVDFKCLLKEVSGNELFEHPLILDHSGFYIEGFPNVIKVFVPRDARKRADVFDSRDSSYISTLSEAIDEGIVMDYVTLIVSHGRELVKYVEDALMSDDRVPF